MEGNYDRDGAWHGSWLNYISEDKMKYVSDAEGRPVIGKSGHRSYQVSSLPASSIPGVPAMIRGIVI